MSHEAAKVLLDTILRHCAEQDAALAGLEGVCTPDEFTAYRRMIGKTMGAMLVELVSPIVSKYPDLKPPQMT